MAEFDAAGILFDLRSRLCLELNRTGIEVIGHLNGHDTLGQIIARLAISYGLPEAHLEKDIEGFIASLNERNLLDDGNGQKNTCQG
jgi:hypothetical protein